MDLESEWNALADRYATPLLRHEWFAAAFDAFGTGCDLAIHVVRDGGRMRAIAPFVIERGLVSRLALLGHQTSSRARSFTMTVTHCRSCCIAYGRGACRCSRRGWPEARLNFGLSRAGLCCDFGCRSSLVSTPPRRCR